MKTLNEYMAMFYRMEIVEDKDEAALEEGIEIHEPDSINGYSGQFKLRIPRSLHRALAEHSQWEGVSVSQYCVYLLSQNDAMYSK